MYSESCRTIAAMLNGYISSCSPEQVQELKQLLIDTISDIDNDNLTEQKSVESEQENKSAEPEKQRADNVVYDFELAQRVYNTAKKFPNLSMDKIDEKLGLPDTTVRTSRAKIYFKGENRRLNNICKLGRLMCGKDERRYRREIENYDDME